MCCDRLFIWQDVGGDDVKQTVRGVMNRIMKRTVSLHFSYMGRKGKHAFCELG